jgi:hypothetical protein
MYVIARDKVSQAISSFALFFLIFLDCFVPPEADRGGLLAKTTEGTFSKRYCYQCKSFKTLKLVIYLNFDYMVFLWCNDIKTFLRPKRPIPLPSLPLKRHGGPQRVSGK